MKTERILLRVSPEDKRNIKKAVVKFHKETGAKRNVSAMLRHVVKQYSVSTEKVSRTGLK